MRMDIIYLYIYKRRVAALSLSLSLYIYIIYMYMHTVLVYSPQESLYPSIVMVIYSQFEASAPKLPLQVSLHPSAPAAAPGRPSVSRDAARARRVLASQEIEIQRLPPPSAAATHRSLIVV